MAVQVLGVTAAEDPGGFTLYSISLQQRGGARSWQVRKRYSELYAFYQSIQRECSGLEHQFPPKKIGKLSPEQTEKRRQQLEAFLRELVDTILSPPVKLALHDFLDIKDEAPPLPDPPSSTPPRAQQPDRSSSAAEEEASRPVWSDAFMSSDPLAQLSLEGSSKPKPAPVAKQPPARPVPPPTDATPPSASKPGPTPSTFMNNRKPPESYAVTGEGLRQAIMNRDLEATTYLLGKDASLVHYQDRQAESMLHLACIFNLSDIALALVKAGASVELKNGHDETAVDIAQPALRTKLQAAVKARTAATTS